MPGNLEHEEKGLTFWEHLEVLRWTIVRILVVIALIMAVFYTFSSVVFTNIIFAPLNSDFWFYRFLCHLSELTGMNSLCPPDFNINLINYNLAGQFLMDIGATFALSLVLGVPYILFEIWRFIRPALYKQEKKHVGLIFLSASLLFYAGVAVAYGLIFPLTVRFLGTYQISPLVPNQISIQSYMGTLYILIFSLGFMFEMPVLAFLLSKAGLIHKQLLQKIRAYAFVIILILAAVITPTTDPFTMLVVTLPVYLLYELSIMVTKKKKIEEA